MIALPLSPLFQSFLCCFNLALRTIESHLFGASFWFFNIQADKLVQKADGDNFLALSGKFDVSFPFVLP